LYKSEKTAEKSNISGHARTNSRMPFYFGGGVGADRLLRFAGRLRPAAPRTVALDRGLFEGSPDLLTTATPSRVLLPPLPQLKKAALMAALLVVEVVGVEPTSESISAGISPSAVNDLKFRFSGRPLTGCRSGYPVSPLKYREIPQSFPV